MLIVSYRDLLFKAAAHTGHDLDIHVDPRACILDSPEPQFAAAVMAAGRRWPRCHWAHGGLLFGSRPTPAERAGQ